MNKQSKPALIFLRQWRYIFLGSILLVVLLLAYSPTLFNFLIADDFLFMGWAYQAISRPMMVLEQYYTVHPLIAPGFYRPFLCTVLYFCYKLWGTNGLYYRLLNVFLQFSAGLMVGFFTYMLSKNYQTQNKSFEKQIKAWAFFSFAIFTLYPLQSESIVWITVLTNPLIAIFTLLALSLYLQWRDGRGRKYFILSIAATVLSFLTKETAVSIPPTIFIYDLLFIEPAAASSAADTEPVTQSFFKQIFTCLKRTLPYWLILVLYFGVRKAVLGDFVAGYPDYTCPQNFSGWLHGLQAIFIPINSAIIHHGSLLFKLWYICLFIAVTMTTIAIIRMPHKQRKIVYFLAFWFFLTLAPNYKVFSSFMSAGYGSRLVYLCMAPLSMLLAYGLGLAATTGRIIWPTRILTLFILALSATILLKNNLAWAEAGTWTNKVIHQLQNYYKDKNGDPLVYIAGLPSTSKTGIYSIGILRWVTLRPFFKQDLINCVRLEDEPYVNVLFVKKAICNGEPIDILYWDDNRESLRGANQKELLIPDTRDTTPVINFSVFPGDRPGQLRVGTKGLFSNSINYDVSSIKDAVKVVLNVTQVAIMINNAAIGEYANKSFLLKKWGTHSKGTIYLNEIDLAKEPAVYKAWLIPLNKNNVPVGVPSDFFFIRTDR